MSGIQFVPHEPVGAVAPLQTVQRAQMPMVAPAQYVTVPTTTYAAPMVQPMNMSQFAAGQPIQLNLSQLQALAVPSKPRGPADLLARGNLVSENYVTEDFLIQSGNLIVDRAAEAAVAARLGQMQMHMQFLAIEAGPHGGGVHHHEQHQHGGGVHHHEQHQHTGPTSEWMFGDAATGWLGIHALAHLNPLRWSGAQSFEKTMRDLEDVAQHENRPIIMKIPANTGHEMEFASPADAINHLISVDAENSANEAQEELLRTQEAFSPSQQAVVAEPVQPAPALTGAAGRLSRAGFAVN